MKIKKSVRYVCLGLIFAMLCGSVFFGSRSFAKYLEEYKSQQEAGVASPVSVYSRYALTRKQGLEEYSYPITNTGTSLVISDITPGDELSYFFGIEGYDASLTNEVLLQVELSFNVYILALKEETVDGVKTVVKNYAGFETLTTYDLPADIRYRGSITLFSSDTKSTDFETDYKTNIFDSKQNSKVNYTNSDIFISSVNIDGNSIPKHTVGFYLTPGAQETFAYLLKVNLPAQTFGSTDSSYIGAKLFIDLDIHATQVQQKS